MKKSILSVAIVAMFIMVISTGFMPNPAKKCEKEMAKIMKDLDVVGLSVAVVKDNHIIYNKSFGYKNLETKEPLTNDCIFRIASISKSFSVTSIMQLREQGKVSLDTDVSELAGFRVRNPKFPDKVITIGMLMSHLSSLNDTQGYFNLNIINPATNSDWAKCYNDYEPGTGYQYCNLNLNMVGTFIEKISGERFDLYVKHHILDPLGLYGGYCVDSLDSSRFARIYLYNNEKKCFDESPEAYAPRLEEIKNYVMGYSTPIFSPTGGMKISALDLAKYMMMHMNYGTSPLGNVKIISEESSKIMQTKLSKEQGYGMGLWIEHNYIPDVVLVGHTGGAYGLRSEMFFDPEKKFGIVVISNGALPETDAPDKNILKATIRCLYNNFIK